MISRLRIDAVQGAGKGDGFPYMVEAADPRDRALNAHAEAAVGNAAVAAQVQIPLKGFPGQLVLVNAAAEQLIARHALRTADDFAVARSEERRVGKACR